jgi:alpha-L-rhamnosidase
VSDDGTIHSDAQTVYALAIVFGLLDEPVRQRAGGRLAELVVAAGHRIATGFAGTPFVLDALAATGHLDEAYRLLLQRESPSWLYPVTMDATTIWERWDSMLPDGSINPGQMTSFNHYALGAVADWMHRFVGGIAPAEPGHRTVRVAPRPGGGLSWARTALESRHGRIEAQWHLDDDRLVVDVTVPDGVTAEVELPDGQLQRVTGGRRTLTGVAGAPASEA